MTMISYSQDGEDVLLQRAFAADHVGFYIDIGANDPVSDSVTKHFYDRGWRGVNVEPIAGLFDRLRVARPRDVNLMVGVSDREEELTFYESPELPGWSTFSPGMASSYRDRGMALREHRVPVMTLAHICEEHCPGPIDFLKVDAEGFEREVLAGGDWTRWRPRVVVIEDAWPERWEHLLLDAGYRLVHRSQLNRFYVRAEDGDLAEMLAATPGRDDDFVRHRHARMLADLNDRFERGEDFGPAALRVAVWLRRQAAHRPRLAAVCRRITRTLVH